MSGDLNSVSILKVPLSGLEISLSGVIRHLSFEVNQRVEDPASILLVAEERMNLSVFWS
jgi:hypothetical protein